VRGLVTRFLDGHTDGLGQQRPLVVLGDLNDTEYAATTSLLYGPGGSEIGTGGFAQPDQGDASGRGTSGWPSPSSGASPGPTAAAPS